MALDFTLLTTEQIWGDAHGNGQLDVMKKYGTKVAPSDLAVLLGGWVSDDVYRTAENDLTCRSWSVSYGPWGVSYVGDNSDELGTYTSRRDISVRPVLPPSETKELQPANTKIGVNGVELVEYGEYPQTVAAELSGKLESLLISKSLRPTGKNYVFDKTDLNDSKTSFQAEVHREFELDGKKYIRVWGRPGDKKSKISTGRQVIEKPYWVRVEPIEWLKDPTGTWVSKKCLFAGIQFDTNKIYDGHFEDTFMKQYLDAYFAKEIEPSERVANKEVIKGLNERLSEISDLEKLKETITPARTPERTDTLARIVRVRKAKALLSAAAKEAQKEGDQKTLQEIVELAKPFAAREASVRNKLHERQAAKRAARLKKERG